MKGLKNMAEEKGEILIYSSDDGVTKIDVRLEDETVWLTQQQLADLYHTSKSNVSEHITNIFKEGELDEAATVRKFRTVQMYKKYPAKTLSSVEKDYLETIESLGKIERKK